MEIQKEKLQSAFVNWKGELERVDDVWLELESNNKIKHRGVREASLEIIETYMPHVYLCFKKITTKQPKIIEN